MLLTDAQIAEFQELYKNRFGKEISKERALEQGTKLVCLMKAIYHPLTEEQLEKAKRRIDGLN